MINENEATYITPEMRKWMAKASLNGQLKDFDIRIFPSGAVLWKYIGQRKVVAVPPVIGIEQGAFEGAEIEVVVIPSTVQYVSAHAFMNCKEIKEIDLKNVEAIGSHAFKGCSKLEKAEFNNCRKIGEWAFSGTALKEVTIPKGAVVDRDAFNYCLELEIIRVHREDRESLKSSVLIGRTILEEA